MYGWLQKLTNSAYISLSGFPWVLQFSPLKNIHFIWYDEIHNTSILISPLMVDS